MSIRPTQLTFMYAIVSSAAFSFAFSSRNRSFSSRSDSSSECCGFTVTRYTGDLEQRPYQRSMERRTLVQRNLSRLK